MRRREFITLLGSAATWPLGARAQQAERPRKIGYLVFTSAFLQARYSQAFQAGLRNLGYVEGKNFVIERSIGRSPGFAPLRILSTNAAAAHAIPPPIGIVRTCAPAPPRTVARSGSRSPPGPRRWCLLVGERPQLGTLQNNRADWHTVAVLARDDAEAVVLDLVQPRTAGGRSRGLGRETWRDEAERQGHGRLLERRCASPKRRVAGLAGPDPSKQRKRSEKLRDHLQALASKPTPLNGEWPGWFHRAPTEKPRRSGAKSSNRGLSGPGRTTHKRCAHRERQPPQAKLP